MNTPNNTDPTLSVELLQAIAAQQGVPIEEGDLEPVLAFLEVLLPQLRAMEELVSAQTVPASLFLPTHET